MTFLLLGLYTLGMPRKHTLPAFLEGIVQPDVYERWLNRKALAHCKRDRGRGRLATRALYKEAIHAAVLTSDGRDAYTGEVLHWHLISTYKNEDSSAGRHSYKSGFALLPTVDHVSAGASEAAFCICGWRTNDAKNDLSQSEFVDLCKKVLAHAATPSGNRNKCVGDWPGRTYRPRLADETAKLFG